MMLMEDGTGDIAVMCSVLKEMGKI